MGLLLTSWKEDGTEGIKELKILWKVMFSNIKHTLKLEEAAQEATFL